MSASPVPAPPPRRRRKPGGARPLLDYYKPWLDRGPCGACGKLRTLRMRKGFRVCSTCGRGGKAGGDA